MLFFFSTSVMLVCYSVETLTAILKELLMNFLQKEKWIRQMKLFENVCTRGKAKSKYLFFLFLVNSSGSPITQPFKFISAYGTPEFTNYTYDFKGCLDYIFFEESKMTCIKTTPLPCEDDLSANVALPSRYFPSDHLALSVDLELLV